jgi:hypothetical protein
MAQVIQPDSITQHSFGSSKLVQAVFSAGTADDGDWWMSGFIGNVIGFWTQDTDNPTTQVGVGTACEYTASSGKFLFYPAEDNKPFILYVMVNG